MWPIIALLVTLARGLPRNCAGPTALPDDFLLPEAEALACGLPVSRSYLLSAHNMVLVVEAPAEAPVAGEPYSMTVRGCDAAAPGPWTDAYSFAAPDLAWCEPDALELWARARGPTIEVADVTPSATECAWTLAFPRGLAAGDYEIDACLGPDGWRGGPFFHVCPHKKRAEQIMRQCSVQPVRIDGEDERLYCLPSSTLYPPDDETEWRKSVVGERCCAAESQLCRSVAAAQTPPPAAPAAASSGRRRSSAIRTSREQQQEEHHHRPQQKIRVRDPAAQGLRLFARCPGSLAGRARQVAAAIANFGPRAHTGQISWRHSV